MKKGWGENRWKRVARFRLGSSVKGRMYWEGEEKRKCRLCESEEEIWEHIWEKCCKWTEEGVWQERVEEILGEEGEGKDWMRKLEDLWSEGRREGVRDMMKDEEEYKTF